MTKIDTYTFKVLNHIVKIGNGDTLQSPWQRQIQPREVRCGLGLWVQIDDDKDIRPKRHDEAMIKEYLSIVETEKDFDEWVKMFIL